MNNLFLTLRIIHKLKIRSKSVVCNTACYVAVERLYPVFQSKRTKVKQVKDLKKKIPLYRIKGFFQVYESSEARENFCCNIAKLIISLIISLTFSPINRPLI